MINENTWLRDVLNDVKKSLHKDTKNIHICPCCGQEVPFPTEPGEWEYCEYPSTSNPKWNRVSVRLPESDDRFGSDGLRLWKDDEMIWWPSGYTAWRKV